MKRVVRAALCILGGALFAHGIWGYRTDPAARATYLASPSCAAARLKPPVVVGGSDGCSIERATIVKRYESDVRGIHKYWVHVSPVSGRVDVIMLGRGSVAQRFWLRQKPGGSVWLQRFVAPGYHLTGRVAGIADDQQTLTSLENLFPRDHPNGLRALLGLMLLLFGILGQRLSFRHA